MRKEAKFEAMDLIDRIKTYGKAAKEDLKQTFVKNGLSEHDLFFSSDYTELHLKLAKEVMARWHTTKKFKVGDKVHVVPTDKTLIPYCIRATVTEVNDDGWGYRLRAFESDLPGIYMFNMWDKDLEPRVGKARKPTPPELLIKRDD
jgi:hypothetical protein